MSIGNSYNQPTYSLEELKRLLQNPATRIITMSARQYASTLGFLFDREIIKRVCQLKESEFQKTMNATKMAGFKQDVYLTQERGAQLYIKLQKSADGKAVVISFK